MIAAVLSRIGGMSTIIGALVGLVLGLALMRGIAGLWIIPAAERVVAAEVRREFANAAFAGAIEAMRESREIEQEVRHATDEDLRCLLGGDCGERLRP